jgi:hypothetical protein
MDLLTTYVHHSELQAIITLSLIYTLYKSLAHAKSSQSSLDVSWQRLLTVEILQLLALRFLIAAARAELNSLNYSAISSQTPLQSSTELPTLTKLDCPSCLLYNSSARTTSKTPFFCCCVHVCFGWNMFTEPLIRNGRLFIRLLHSNGCTRCLIRGLCLTTGL